MQALKIATIIFNIAMLLWMIVLDCKEKNTGTSVPSRDEIGSKHMDDGNLGKMPSQAEFP